MVNLTIATALALCLIVLAVCDLRTGRLPDMLTLPLIGAGLLLTGVESFDTVPEHVLAAAVGYLSLKGLDRAYLSVRGRHGVGGGDAKLLAAAGAWVGLEMLAIVLFLAAVFGLAAAGFQRRLGESLSRLSPIAFGPALGMAFFLVWAYVSFGWTLN